MNKVIIFLLVLYPFFISGQSNQVRTEYGPIEGLTSDDKQIRIFKGIPFAAPPVGDLRWKAPQPPEPWQAVKLCTAFGPSPMQSEPSPFMFWSSEFLIPKAPISEDCLYLNVWTAAKPKKEKLPVLVYIYGGGFRSGGSGCAIYDGEAMARKGVVFVSINYRVGVFGFFAHPELSRESSYGTSGNYAMLDMIAALQWVRKNISAFGGDPDNVTIAGQSAGAFSVSFLTASPLAKGLFHRAIAQSGGSFLSSPLRPALSLKDAEKQGVEFAKTALQCQSLEELRSKSAEAVLSARGGLSGPIVDGVVLPESNVSIYQKGKQQDVPLLLGWNQDDKLMLQPQPAAEFRAQMKKRFGDDAADFFQFYPAQTEEEAAQSQFELSRDQAFAVQGFAWAKIQKQHGRTGVYLYNFNRGLPAYTADTEFGAFHSGEIVYAYDNLQTLDRPWEAVDHQIAEMMSSYWVNFARTGDPNGKGLPKWKPFGLKKERILIIDENPHSALLAERERLRFLEAQIRKN